ncbi:hypothetical protein AAE478_005765 [Parahypoxylon ruwenzoriense]
MATPSIPAEMKAVQVTAFNEPYKLNTVPVPAIGPHDLLVKVAVASYCHTDSMMQEGIITPELPVTASHEGSGTVVAVGDQVSAFKLGDRVICGLPLHPCGACPDCVGPEEWRRQYCVNLEGHIGVHVNGCMAEYVRVDARFTTKLPSEISFLEAAPLACAGRTVWRAVPLTGLKAGEWVAIVGSGGGLGHLCVQFAQAMRLKVIGIEARDEALELSRRNGADLVFDARDGQAAVVGQVQKATGGEGAHAAIVLSNAPDSAALGCAVTRMHGTMVQIAQPEAGMVIPFRELIFRDIRIKSSLLCSPKESEDMVRFIAEQRRSKSGVGISVETNAFEGLEKVGELMELVHSGRMKGKGVVVVDKEQVQGERIG